MKTIIENLHVLTLSQESDFISTKQCNVNNVVNMYKQCGKYVEVHISKQKWCINPINLMYCIIKETRGLIYRYIRIFYSPKKFYVCSVCRVLLVVPA